MLLNANAHGYRLSVPLETFTVMPVQVRTLFVLIQSMFLISYRHIQFKRILMIVVCGQSCTCSQCFEDTM